MLKAIEKSTKTSGREDIVMTTRADRELREFRALITQYSAAAHALNARKRELAEMISAERNVDKIKELELRKSTIEAERYEVLDDMRALISYVKEREKCTGAR